MSKRYGRQQKRKARDEIVKLKDDLMMATGLTKYFHEQMDEANSVVQHMVSTVENVCINSIALPPRTLEHHAGSESIRLMRKEELGLVKYDAPVPQLATSRTVDCYRFEAVMQKYHEALQSSIHCCVRYKDTSKVSYMISEQGLKDMPIDFLIRQVSNDLVRHLKKG